MEQYILDQIKYGLKLVPSNLAKSFFVKKENDDSRAVRERGFIRGVCHPREQFDLIKEANIGWIRVDIPFPFKADGTLSERYVSFKERCLRFKQQGIQVMAITPYPQDYLEYGADIRTEEGCEKTKEIARFLIKDMQEVAGALQVTNEMGIPRFTIPFDMDEAARFIGLQLKEMYPLRGDLLIGFNCAGPAADLCYRMQPYARYMDYIGIDIYVGCFDSYGGFLWMFDALIRYLWSYFRKPVLLQEFGYIGEGRPKSRKQKNKLLAGYGAKDEAEAEKNIEAFVENLPDTLRDHTKYLANNDPTRYADLLFRSDLKNHLYRELPKPTKIPGFDHTPEGQAKFFAELLPHLYSLPFVCGAIIYCWADSDKCYICGQSDCPTETRWGLVTREGRPKPSYYAVKKAFGQIKWADSVNGK